jgi:KUP system potassium uptake protein
MSNTPAHDAAHAPHAPQGSLRTLALGALGVVYGDIGTSPLYAIKECFKPASRRRAHAANVLGILSLIVLVARAGDRGEVHHVHHARRQPRRGRHPRPAGARHAAARQPRRPQGQPPRRAALVPSGSSAPRSSTATASSRRPSPCSPRWRAWRWPPPRCTRSSCPSPWASSWGSSSCRSAARRSVGAIFGPATLVWFVSIAAAGLPWIVRRPEVLAPSTPGPRGAVFPRRTTGTGSCVLGSVVLCITGGEALYADMGHFGRKPIRLAWYAVVMPALLLNYFGQGALLLAARRPPYATTPSSASSPGCLSTPWWPSPRWPRWWPRRR